MDFGSAQAEGIVVTYHPTGETWTLGSGGMSLYEMVESRGLEKVTADPPAHVGFVVADLPAYIPIANATVQLELGSGPCTVTLLTKRRGQEQFSSLDTTGLPYFTGLVIRKEGLVGNPRAIVKEVLQYFDDFARMLNIDVGPLHNNERFSLIVFYERLDQPGTPIARSVYPLPGEHRLPNPKDPISLTPEIQQAVNKYRLELASLAARTARETQGQPFSARVFALMHDFAFYGRQHPEALGKLVEQEMRDLFVVLLKTVFRGAEGEAFNFNGKSDIKVTNPANTYEFGIIEFKKWRGAESFHEVYSQAVREHATGQEAFLAAIILSSNEDTNSVKDAAAEAFRTEAETVTVRPDEQIAPSREHFFRGTVRIRGNELPFTVGIVDLYFKNVRANE